MSIRDVDGINSAYTTVLTEGVGTKTLTSLAAALLLALGGGQVVKNAADEYTKGMPNLKTPATGATLPQIEQYLSEISKVGVKLDPIHIKTLNALKQNVVEPRLLRVINHQLERQRRITGQNL